MVRRAGQPQGWPGSRVTGSANPVRLTTHEISTSGGELINLSLEDVIMATTLSHPDVTIENGRPSLLLFRLLSFLASSITMLFRK